MGLLFKSSMFSISVLVVFVVSEYSHRFFQTRVLSRVYTSRKSKEGKGGYGIAESDTVEVLVEIKERTTGKRRGNYRRKAGGNQNDTTLNTSEVDSEDPDN